MLEYGSIRETRNWHAIDRELFLLRLGYSFGRLGMRQALSDRKNAVNDNSVNALIDLYL